MSLGEEMDLKQLFKSCIYIGLMVAFIVQLSFAFENLLSERTAYTIYNKKEPIPMPSMTICPAPKGTASFISSKNILDTLKKFSLNMEVIYQNKR